MSSLPSDLPFAIAEAVLGAVALAREHVPEIACAAVATLVTLGLPSRKRARPDAIEDAPRRAPRLEDAAAEESEEEARESGNLSPSEAEDSESSSSSDEGSESDEASATGSELLSGEEADEAASNSEEEVELVSNASLTEDEAEVTENSSDSSSECSEGTEQEDAENMISSTERNPPDSISEGRRLAAEKASEAKNSRDKGSDLLDDSRKDVNEQHRNVPVSGATPYRPQNDAPIFRGNEITPKKLFAEETTVLSGNRKTEYLLKISKMGHVKPCEKGVICPFGFQCEAVSAHVQHVQSCTFEPSAHTAVCGNCHAAASVISRHSQYCTAVECPAPYCQERMSKT